MSGTGIVIGNFIGGATSGGGGGSAPVIPGFNPLSFRIDTNFIVGSNDYTLGVDASGTYDFTVNWGDGQSDVITSPTQPEITHAYSGAGARTISITPNTAYSVDHWSFGRRSSSIPSEALTDIFSFGDIKFYANEDIFNGCENFNTVANRAGVPNFQNRDIIDGFFFRNDSLGTTTEPDFSGWGTFTGTGLQFLRGNNLPPFSSSRVNVNFTFTPTSLQEAFLAQALFNSSLSNWTVSSCNNFSKTFSLASSFNQPLPWVFSTDAAVSINASEMFKDALAFNQDISSWNTSRFTDTSSMFESTSVSVFNQDISSWNTDSITNASSMFSGATSFTSDLSNWFSTGSLVNATLLTGGIIDIFKNAVAFDGAVDGWDTSNLTSLNGSFQETSSFNQSLGSWDVGNVQFFIDTFNGSKLFVGLGLPGWNTSSAVSFSGMFNGASAFNQDLSSWDISSLTSASDMLTGTAISQSNWDSLLIGWATQAPNIQNNVTLSDIPVIHSAGKPKDAYDKLVSAPYNWTITDLGGAAPPPSFSFTIDTTSTEAGSSAANQYRLPLMSTGTYDFYVNWGDGTLGDQITTWNQSEATHTYASSGTYTISIQAVSLSGGTPSIDHISWASQNGTTISAANDRLKVQDITSWGNAQIYLNEYVFSTCNNLDITTTVEPTFGSRVLRSDTFNDCSSFAGDISSWGTQAPITGDASIFYQNGGQNPNVNFNAQLTGSFFVSFSGASNFNSSLSNWDVSSVTSLSRTFQNASSFNQNISTWDVSSVSNLSNTFNGATAFDQDLSSWDVRNVTTASNMFTNSGLSAANWDALLIGWAAQGTGAGSLQANVTLSNINQYHGTVDAAAIAAYNKLTASPYNWNIVDLGELPTSVFEFDIDTAQTVTGSTNADQYRLPLMSTGTYNFTVNWGDGQSNSISTWNQAEATHTYATAGLYSISITGTIDHVSWASQNGTSFSQGNDRAKIKDITDWGPAVIYLNDILFYNCTNMNITTTAAPTFGSKVMRDDYFYNCESFTGDISAWGTVASPITGSVEGILFQSFNGNPNLNFVFQRTSSEIYRAFFFCISYNNPLDNWDVSGSNDFTQAFFGCSTFNQDISGWDVSAGARFVNMFGGAASFNQDISSWDMSSATQLNFMFDGATVFNQDISTWDTSSVTTMQSTFEDATAFNQDLASWDVGSLTTASNMFTNSGISAENWDKLLIGWAAQGTGAGSLQANVTLSDINQLHGSVDSAAIAAYNKLVAAPYSWTIVDLGAAVVGNLLLDTTYGSGAEAAYSVRKLRTAYTGPAIKVQDTVGGATQDIYFDANNNIDEAAIISYGGSNDVFVETWYDQSGNGNDSEQPSSASRPKIYDGTSGSVVKIDGKVAMTLDGSNDAFTTSSNIVGAYSIFTLGNPAASGYYADSTSGSRQYIIRNAAVAGSFSEYQNGTATSNFYGFEKELVAYISNSATTRVINTLLSRYNKIQSYNGDFSEYIIYTSDKSGTDQTSIEENVGDYFTQNTPLLDTYSGAEAAYSLRLLDSTYTGFAIKVQDTVGGATQDIGFNVFGELDTVALAQYGGSNDVFVETWYDQSGNSNNATQPSSLLRPKIYDGTTGVVTEGSAGNEKPAVKFEIGSASTLTTSVNVSTPFTYSAIYIPYQTFALALPSPQLTTTGARECMVLGQITNPGDNVQDKQVGVIAVGDGANSSASSFYDTAQPSEVTFNYTSALDVSFLGNRNSTTAGRCSLQEFIAWPVNQDATNRAGIETNINTFYDIYTEPVAPLLLNNYPGAAAAYSLRRIDSSYKGSAVLVQTTNNTKGPVYIGFDSNNDLDTVSLAAYGGSEEVVVAGWLDQSGNGNDAIQNSATARPVIYRDSTATTPGVVLENGKPAVYFDGTDDKFNLTGFTQSASNYSLHAVTKETSNDMFLFDAQSGRLVFDGRGGSRGVYYDGSWEGTSHSGTSQQLQSIYAISPSSGQSYVDGSQVNTGLPYTQTPIGGNIALGGSYAGSNHCFLGVIQEFIIYPSDQSTNRTDIEENIGGYYDIPLPGLLDENPGAAAAYSLRRLSSTYTGSAIQVQRADNVGGTTDIGFDGYGDLDTAALTTAAAGNDMVVVTWYDQSGNSNNATQPSSLSRPKIYDGQDGVVTENGKPAVDFLSGSYTALKTGGNITNSSTLSFYSVFQMAAAAWQAISAISTDYSFRNEIKISNGRLYNIVGTGSQLNGPLISLGQQTLAYAKLDSSSGELAINGNTATTGTNTSVQSVTNASLAIGSRAHTGGESFTGTIQEVIYWVGTPPTRAGIESNINFFYDIY